MISTKVSQDGMYSKGWYVYVANQSDILAANGFDPLPQEWRLVGYRRWKWNALRLARKAASVMEST